MGKKFSRFFRGHNNNNNSGVELQNETSVEQKNEEEEEEEDEEEDEIYDPEEYDLEAVKSLRTEFKENPEMFILNMLLMSFMFFDDYQR